jgi:succinoglycan biosynthesis protein ExoU
MSQQSTTSCALTEDDRTMRVDVLVAAWNRADTIGKAVSSALAQPEVQTVIVVDDGSTDDTADRAEWAGVGTGRVIVIREPTNRGPSAARNVALAASNARWIAVLDADDYLLPGRMGALLVHAMGCDFVADDIFQVNSEQEEIACAAAALCASSEQPRLLDFGTFVRGNVSRSDAPRQELGFLKPIMRRAFLDLHGLRYDERLRLGEDFAFYARALALGACFLSVIRRNSLSGNHSRQDLERLRDSILDLDAIPGLQAGERRALRGFYRSVDARVQWLAVIEAVKARSAGGFLAPFFRSPTVAAYLAAKLLEQMRERSRAWMSRGRSHHGIHTAGRP